MNYYPKEIKQLVRYRDYDALSQSQLKSILANNTKKFKETVPMLIGSCFDALVTCPTLVNEMFHIGLSKRPSDNIKNFIDNVLCVLLEGQEEKGTTVFYDIDQFRQELLNEAKLVNYQPKWGDDAVWNSIKREGEEYWNEVISSQGKKIITQEEYQLCSSLSSLSLFSSVTGKYFIDSPNIDKYFQHDLYWISEDEPCKGLLDLLVIEHETKTIYIIDIKLTTVSSLDEWFNVARQKNYPFQLSFYKEGVVQNYSDLIEQGYKIKCRWIVVPTNTYSFKPWIVCCTKEMLKVGKSGVIKQTNIYIIDEVQIKGERINNGWKYAIQVYKRCKNESLLDYDLRWFDYQGRLSSNASNNLFFN